MQPAISKKLFLFVGFCGKLYFKTTFCSSLLIIVLGSHRLKSRPKGFKWTFLLPIRHSFLIPIPIPCLLNVIPPETQEMTELTFSTIAHFLLSTPHPKGSHNAVPVLPSWPEQPVVRCPMSLTSGPGLMTLSSLDAHPSSCLHRGIYWTLTSSTQVNAFPVILVICSSLSTDPQEGFVKALFLMFS